MKEYFYLLGGAMFHQRDYSQLKSRLSGDCPKIWLQVFPILLIILTLPSCNKINNNPFFQKTHSIKEILESPGKYHGKTVTIKGKVTESLIALEVGYFVVSDGTESIAVIPSKTFPKVGEEVKIKGTV
ncbi:MAG: hypothetical protein ABH969_10675, partial [Pseudomonadota bacterium]